MEVLDRLVETWYWVVMGQIYNFLRQRAECVKEVLFLVLVSVAMVPQLLIVVGIGQDLLMMANVLQ